jgi:hypothetical protein
MQRIQRIAIAFSLCMVLGLSLGCSKRPNDDTIAKEIQSKLASDPATRDSDVAVSSKDGKVTLTGKASTADSQQRAEQIARDEPGVTGVDDQTSLQSAAMAPAAPMEAPAAKAPAAAPVEKPKPQPIVIPAGTSITVKVGQALSSKDSQEGQTFLATVATPVSVGGKTAIPAGSSASGKVVTAKAKGKIKGEGELSLALTSVTVRGATESVETQVLSSTVKGKGKRTAVTTGGGAAGGALIGGIAGGGKGAGIGALVGAGAGLVGGALTGNKQVEIPAESALTFTLSAPLTLPPSSE